MGIIHINIQYVYLYTILLSSYFCTYCNTIFYQKNSNFFRSFIFQSANSFGMRMYIMCDKHTRANSEQSCSALKPLALGALPHLLHFRHLFKIVCLSIVNQLGVATDTQDELQRLGDALRSLRRECLHHFVDLIVHQIFWTQFAVHIAR